MRLTDCNLSRSQLERLIDEWVFNERNRGILKRKLLDGVTFEAVAGEFDVSVRQAKNIVYKSERILFKHMK